MAVNQYAHLAAQVAAAHGIPKGIFLALVSQESGFNPTARSSVGAYGLTQLMPGTARSLGVNLQDPHSQLEGGARYLQEQFQRFGNWRLALAAYNAGPGNVTSGDWQKFPETQNYVKNILGSAPKYGAMAPTGTGAGLALGTPSLPSAPAPVIKGTAGIDKQAFALDSLDNLGNPGAALNDLSAGKFDTTVPFSQQLQTTHGPPVGNQTHAGGGRIRDGKFVYPLGTKGKIIGVPYQGTHTMYGNWESDNAIDISAPVGTPIYAVSDGVIGSQIGSLNSGDPHLLGLRLHLQTKGNEFYYAHLSRLVVKAGEMVHKGQLLGYSGSANGVSHLHIASKSGNPLSFFRGH